MTDYNGAFVGFLRRGGAAPLNDSRSRSSLSLRGSNATERIPFLVILSPFMGRRIPWSKGRTAFVGFLRRGGAAPLNDSRSRSSLSLRGSNATAAIQTIPLFPNIYFWIASTTACNDGLDIISRQDNTNAKFQFIFLNNLYLKALEHFVRELSVIDEDCANLRGAVFVFPPLNGKPFDGGLINF